MYYRVVEKTAYDQTLSYEYDRDRREEMLEWVRLLMRQHDTAYVHVILVDDDGTILRQKILEGAGYDAYIDNI